MAEISLSEAITKLARLDAAIGSALEIEVSEEAKDCVQEAANEVVYAAYDPKFLSRRMENGGLSDRSNIQTTAAGLTLTVENVAGLQNLWGGNDTSPLTPIVDAGIPKYHMPFARPFMDAAAEKLRSGRASAALRRGLARQGYGGFNGGIDVD